MSEEEDPLFANQTQEQWLRAVYVIVSILFLINLAFAIFNVVKYIKPMPEHSKLIILFYVLVILVCLAHIIFCILGSIEPD